MEAACEAGPLGADVVAVARGRDDDIAPLGQQRLVLADLPLGRAAEVDPPLVVVGVDVRVGWGAGQRADEADAVAAVHHHDLVPRAARVALCCEICCAGELHPFRNSWHTTTLIEIASEDSTIVDCG